MFEVERTKTFCHGWNNLIIRNMTAIIKGIYSICLVCYARLLIIMLETAGHRNSWGVMSYELSKEMKNVRLLFFFPSRTFLSLQLMKFLVNLVMVFSYWRLVSPSAFRKLISLGASNRDHKFVKTINSAAIATCSRNRLSATVNFISSQLILDTCINMNPLMLMACFPELLNIFQLFIGLTASSFCRK